VVNIQHINHFLLKIFRIIFFFLGAIFLLVIIMAFTPLPFYAWYNHALAKAGIHRPPDFIIVLGGGGMPSETGLIRTWYAAKTANRFSRSMVIISLPGDTSNSMSSVNQMKKEMLLRGIDQKRIILEPKGTNTRAQAMQVKNLVDGLMDPLISSSTHQLINSSAILIVTSPEHLSRAVLTFKKAGFLKVDGVPAFETDIESDITFNDRSLGGREWIPGVGGNLAIRYQFWTQLRYEEMMIREYLALFYYKLKGWI
jgi:uncharacterized SAM-binding protein YcdF (DUF218 family)